LRQLCAHGEKVVGQKMYRIILKAEGEGRETRKRRRDAVLRLQPLRTAARGAPGLALRCVQRFVVGLLSLAMLSGAENRAGER